MMLQALVEYYEDLERAEKICGSRLGACKDFLCAVFESGRTAGAGNLYQGCSRKRKKAGAPGADAACRSKTFRGHCLEFSVG